MDEPSSTALDDATLLDRLRRGDRGAAALLVQRHNRALWRIARGILRHDADAEDAVQDGYLRAFTRIHEFRSDAGLGTWLARIVINEALRRLGTRRAMVDVSELTESAASGDPWRSDLALSQDPERTAARQELRRTVERAVDALPVPFRLVFIMRVIEQASIEETAAALAVPPATVKTRLHRANQTLRRTLEAEPTAVFEDAFPFGGARCERLTRAVVSRLRLGDAPVPRAPRNPAMADSALVSCAGPGGLTGRTGNDDSGSWQQGWTQLGSAVALNTAGPSIAGDLTTRQDQGATAISPVIVGWKRQ